MTDRTATDRMANALHAAGVAVSDIVRRTHPQESDLVRLEDEYYVALDYEYFERGGIVHVSFNHSMHSGGDIEIESWMIPDVSQELVVTEIAAYRVQ
jgi:hypothetical protein